ncbi:YbdK family carboxylate-amine ligase [Georgenia yuyongxinii]|uniref:Putative glutamate--cysteine ligase 2 n=1 Tax=Georgenia yuyongxinii TaxID=2589797 RepID=A0A5B8C7A9_9MICO|nr:glutamate--cysteine ligase [Georgenia yuyongxinii]QDC26338.1 YbdK family carboxylate-amine ligase [Georgenia yuyongxinii]
MRTVGVEEELLLVEPGTGHALAVAHQVIADVRAHGAVGRAGEPGGRLVHEMAEQQVEINSRPHTNLTVLEEELRAWRHRAVTSAHSAGAEVAALATYPAEVRPQVAGSARYEDMVDRFGLTGRQHMTSGCHVHVGVGSREEAVGVVDRIRVWLPALLSLSANSPFWQGEDTGFASFRCQLMLRWPSAGPTELFGSAAAYDAVVARMVETGVLLDGGMVYFEARASHRFPTVEIRAADVCLDVADTVLVAALCRGLVETAAQAWAAGEPPAPVPVALLRLATWRASHDGLEGELLDPFTASPRPAADVVAALLEHVGPALRASGDEALATERLAAVLARGTGARRQRAILRRTGSLAAVVADAARVTAGEAG